MSKIVFIFAAIAFLTAYNTALEVLDVALHFGEEVHWIGIHCDPTTHETDGAHIWQKVRDEFDGTETKITNIHAKNKSIGDGKLVPDLRRHKVKCINLSLHAN